MSYATFFKGMVYMIFLLNIVPNLIVFFGGIVFIWFANGWKRKVSTVLMVIGLCLIYNGIQPDYITKGTVRSGESQIDFQKIDGPMTDRLMKPKSAEQYDLERKEALDAIDKSIKEQIQKQSQTK